RCPILSFVLTSKRGHDNSCSIIYGYFPQSLLQTQTQGHIAMCPYMSDIIPVVEIFFLDLA
ncbi:MAG: hypothetical protein SVY10_05980, partial [Thermodesulfobacteriota bacterium]|nr:hypothetical protein [Thermodesulfobacteriota bacterium]